MQINTIDVKTKQSAKLELDSYVINELELTVAFSGNTTIAVTDLDNTRGIGIAHCMPGDKYSREIGVNLASARALRHIADQMEKEWNDRSVTQEDWAKKHNKKG